MSNPITVAKKLTYLKSLDSTSRFLHKDYSKGYKHTGPKSDYQAFIRQKAKENPNLSHKEVVSIFSKEYSALNKRSK